MPMPTVHQIYTKARRRRRSKRRFPAPPPTARSTAHKLSAQVVHDPAAMKQLEQIVHPMLGASRQKFFDDAERSGAPVAVVDVPLLFETGGEKRVDAVVVVTTTPEIQRERILARDNMTGRKARRHPGAAVARRRKAQARRFRGGYLAWSRPGARADPRHSANRLLKCRSGAADSPPPGSRPMREIVLDTETTGLDPLRGDRLVEIGCVEMFNRMPTGQTFHRHSIPSATCRPRPSTCTAFPASSSPTSRCSPMWSTSSSNSSATRRW